MATQGRRFAQDFERIDEVKANDKILIQNSRTGIVEYANPSQLKDFSPEGTVRYDSEQDLTPSQQGQARENIGLAELIPPQASGENPLSDKAFVNSSVQTATANFRGDYADWQTVPTTESGYPADYAGGKKPTVNDYMVVQHAETYFPTADEIKALFPPSMFYFKNNSFCTHNGYLWKSDVMGLITTYPADEEDRWFKICAIGDILGNVITGSVNAGKVIIYNDTLYKVLQDSNLATQNPDLAPERYELLTAANVREGTWRFKYTGSWDVDGVNGWKPEYQVNKRPLTAAQLAALNSNITAEKVAEIDGKQDKLIAGEGISIAPDGKTISAQGTGAVRYDATQTLTAEQKQQARQNIDAPSKDGYYEEMGVGYAKSLLGNGAATQELIDFRPSGGTKDIGTGVATIKKVQGNSVVMNQRIPITAQSQTVRGVTLTNNNDGSFTLRGTATGGSASLWIASNAPTGIYYIICRRMSGDSFFFGSGSNGEYDRDGNGVIAQTLGTFGFVVNDGVTLDTTVYPQIFNLTQMFGAGNEPTTTDDTRIKWIERQGYIPYTEGQLLNYKGEGLNTTGVNQWDEEWELGAISVLGYLISDNTRIRPKNYIPLIPSSTYYFYCGSKPSGLRHVIFYEKEGDTSSIGAASLDNNGVFTAPANAHFCKFSWETYVDYGATYHNDIQIAIYHSGGDIPNTYHPYEEHTLALPITSLKANGVTIFPDGMRSAGTVKDELYGDVLGIISKARKYCETRPYQEGDEDNATLITDGINTIYPLATPEEYTLDTPINTVYQVNDWGTEQNLPQGKDTQWLPLTTPLNAEIVYSPNVQDAIKNLPKNYIGKESMDAILNAFKTAGIIASFTLTYDATSGKYKCTIVKQS